MPSLRVLLVFVSSAALSGCGLLIDFEEPEPPAARDGGTMDGARPRDGGSPLDAPPLGPCDGVPEGDPCAAAGDPIPAICIRGVCARSYCGDGFVDIDRGEQCDDGNTAPGDGCEPGCTTSCGEDTDCSDGRPCNGEESCVAGACTAGTPLTDGMSCDSGVCTSGLCLLPSCGDLVVDAGEECDDGNDVSGDGCEPDCTRTCAPGTRPCASTACESGVCLADATCMLVPADRDGDGAISGESTPMGRCGGTDCNDMDPTVHPGAADVCNLVDDDCDGRIDEGAPPLTCYRDNDADGFGSDAFAPIVSCRATCPSGYVDRPGDCDDLDARAFPGQTDWFAMPTRGTRTYDFDCSGSVEHEFESLVPSLGLVRCLGRCDAIWIGTQPPCGGSGLLVHCSDLAGFCGLPAPQVTEPARCH